MRVLKESFLNKYPEFEVKDSNNGYAIKFQKTNTKCQKRRFGKISKKLLFCATNIKPKAFEQHPNTKNQPTIKTI